MNLAESYQPITLEQMAIQQYAYFCSVKKVAEKLNELDCNTDVEKLNQVIFQILLKVGLKISYIHY